MRKSHLLTVTCMCIIAGVVMLTGCNNDGQNENISASEDERITQDQENIEETEITKEDETTKVSDVEKPENVMVTELLTGTKWWEGAQSSRDYVLSGDGYMVFDIYASPDNDIATNAYCVEAYDDEWHYLTTTSDATVWYAGTTGTLYQASPDGAIVPGETVRVVFTRKGNTYTVEYLDGQTEEYIFDKIVAVEAGRFKQDLKLHVMAQIGTFKVTMIEKGKGEYVKRAANNDAIVVEDKIRLDEEDSELDENLRSRVSVHDPSIVIGYIYEKIYTGSEKIYAEQNSTKTRSKVYFIFGTCLSSAYSNDLENWTSFENNLNRDYEKIFAKEKAWSSAGDSDYNLFWSIWAPDVMWNPKYANEDGTEGAWMMYVSVNGAAFNSSIALLTTKDLKGDWTYRGTVVYSGYSEKGTTFDYTKTDYLKYAELDADGTLPDRYIMPEYLTSVAEEYNTWNKNYCCHAIDPNVFFDEDGKMRMIYGSFAGGIYMLEMDATTGFRSNRVYKVDTDTSDGIASDPYCGIRIAGGNDTSVEGAYIKYYNDRYYLFVSVGGCYTYTGYNMRVLSSGNVEGEYKDYLGNSAFEVGPVDGNIGARLMFSYKWGWKKRAQLAQGHNSVYVDDNGKMFLIYHEKTDNGTDYNRVQVHQMFETTGGAMVVAPFEYTHTDETDVVYSDKQVIGSYDVILHKTTDYWNLKCNTPKNITLNEDYTITGAYKGTWKMVKDTSNVVLTIDGVEYHGRFLKQTIEDTNVETMCFTTISQKWATDAMWGMKVPDDAHCVNLALKNMPVVDKELSDGMLLPTEGACGTKITWYCDGDYISKDGIVSCDKGGKAVTLYAVVSKGEYYSVRSYINRTLID
ncbi:MAG: glycoside hydrolase family 43 protein [Lachnospiraceae bacterium]|nr:glycoside hydrolase family 43 protein [Lachnospiraceae bacterium]